ncbi:hypothetical protein HGM15179_022311 [Zosterops borbonicus]|uniref:Uncharacterized protein n=1 Tax=Zosterops borbonicus TaxID=364589 RepID=A0A8K1D561_9PASS|nr:hypothetical protein HGM15179_022311 [Zosterops borbonicus]
MEMIPSERTVEYQGGHDSIGLWNIGMEMVEYWDGDESRDGDGGISDGDDSIGLWNIGMEMVEYWDGDDSIRLWNIGAKMIRVEYPDGDDFTGLWNTMMEMTPQDCGTSGWR